MREDATVHRVRYTVTFRTTSPTTLLKHASHSLAGQVRENVENVMTSISTKMVADFKRALSRDEASVFHVPYAVTFSMLSPTGLLKHMSHVLTVRFSAKHRKRDHIVLLGSLDCY